MVLPASIRKQLGVGEGDEVLETPDAQPPWRTRPELVIFPEGGH